MDKVTVWLTSYNHEKFLRESIESILAQTYTQFNLYIVDDCSQDGSWEIIQEYAQMDSRIKAIRHEKNMGASGLASCVNDLPGEYIAIAHSDDVWDEHKLEKQIEYLDNHKEAGACFTLVQLIDDNGRSFESEKHQLNNIFQESNRNRYEWLHYFFFNRNCLCHPSVVVRKNAYSDYQLFPKGLNGYPDFFQWVRLCKNAEIYIVQEQLTKFRVHTGEENDSGEKPENLKRINIEEIFVMEQYKELIDTHEVVKVFPETKQYIINGSMIEEYALAQMYLQGPGPAHWIIGFKMLYDLFQDDNKTEAIKQKYGYTKKSYNQDKQKYDVFNIIPQERYLHVTLFFDRGMGYSEDDCIKQAVYIPVTGKYKIEFVLTEELCKNVQKIRIDLDEGCYRKFKLQKVMIGDRNEDLRAVNGEKDAGEWDAFYTADPQYEMTNIQSGILSITGITEIIEINEVDNYFYNIKVEKEQLIREADAIRKELEKIKKTKTYKTLSFLGKIKNKLFLK